MEILIIGVVIVALMAYVSTRIKKHTANAYKAEMISTGGYSVIKPDGYIVPWNEEKAFRAISKDMGNEKGAEKMYQSRADLRIFSDLDFDEVCRGARKSVSKLLREETARDEHFRYCFINARTTENEVVSDVYYKIVENLETKKVYELEVTVLSEATEAYSAKASEILQSFTVKENESVMVQEGLIGQT